MKTINILLLLLLSASFTSDNDYDIAITKVASNFNDNYNINSLIVQEIKLGNKLSFVVTVTNIGTKDVLGEKYEFSFSINNTIVALDAYDPNMIIKPNKSVVYSKERNNYHFIADSIGIFNFIIKAKLKKDVNKKNNTVEGRIIVTK